MNASTRSVAPKRYAWMASRIYPRGLLIIVIIVMTEPFFMISEVEVCAESISDIFCPNIPSFHNATKFIDCFLFNLTDSLSGNTKYFPD